MTSSGNQSIRLFRTLLLCLPVLAGGCIIVPILGVPHKSAQVGDDRSAPLRVGSADRAAVLAKLGPPTYREYGDRTMGYVFQEPVVFVGGFMLTGPCSTPWIGTAIGTASEDLWLEFDDAGILRRYAKQLAGPHGEPVEAWTEFRGNTTTPSPPGK